MFRKETEKGVSPVVGVILMVAITVILAAIIATFVLDLGGTVSQNPQAGVSFDQNSTAEEVDVQIVSMENADTINVSRSEADDYSAEMNKVGQSVTVGDETQDGDYEHFNGSDSDDADPGLEDGERITVTATLEGKTQVIQTHTYSPKE